VAGIIGIFAYSMFSGLPFLKVILAFIIASAMEAVIVFSLMGAMVPYSYRQANICPRQQPQRPCRSYDFSLPFSSSSIIP